MAKKKAVKGMLQRNKYVEAQLETEKPAILMCCAMPDVRHHAYAHLKHEFAACDPYCDAL